MDWHLLAKPILLFFYTGLVLALLGAHLKKVVDFHQTITYLLLLSIGWHGGEELALLPRKDLWHAVGLMPLGFVTNTVIALISYWVLSSRLISLPKIEAATIAGYYGSDSAGTFATCIAFLGAYHIAFASWMSALLAIMEIPGCIVCLLLVKSLRNGKYSNGETAEVQQDVSEQPSIAKKGIFRSIVEILREEEICLLIGGIVLGWMSAIQGNGVTTDLDNFFVKGQIVILGLFLLGIGYKAGGTLWKEKLSTWLERWRLVAFALIAPNIFAALGLMVMYGYSVVIGVQFAVGTYVLFAALCAPASYIAMSAIHHSLIPEYDVTVPILMSLGVTFTYNVTFGLQLYIKAAQWLLETFPIT